MANKHNDKFASTKVYFAIGSRDEWYGDHWSSRYYCIPFSSYEEAADFIYNPWFGFNDWGWNTTIEEHIVLQCNISKAASNLEKELEYAD